MRGIKQKTVKILQEEDVETSIIKTEVDNMKCPACGEGEQYQVIVETDGMKKPKCTACGTIFYDSSLRE